MTALAMACVVMLPGTGAAGSPDLLPDLRMAKPRDVQLVRYTGGVFAGRTLLRFTTIVTNEGAGPLELRGTRECSSLTKCPRMTVRQRIQRADGTWRRVDTTARMRYDVGDGHKHWHSIGFEEYRLWPIGTTDPEPIAGAKYGFCFFDGGRWKTSAKRTRKYLESGCGTTTSLTTKMGLQAGWSDTYPWNFAGQYVDVTKVPKGEYLMCVTADPKKKYRQSDKTNDEAWVHLRIKASSVVIINTGRSSCEKRRQRLERPVATTAVSATAALVAPGRATQAEEGTEVALRTVSGVTPGFLCPLPGA
ncbi:MAG: hypothetical protein KF809_00225 [Chloroflexi bacterium]|nr:hypothetical protein [Chloroflexota bacterium]